MEHEPTEQEKVNFIAPETGNKEQEEPKTRMHLLKEGYSRWGEGSNRLISDMWVDFREDLSHTMIRDGEEFSADQVQEMIDTAKTYHESAGVKRLEWLRDYKEANGNLSEISYLLKHFPE